MILKRAIAVFTAAAIGFAVMVAAALPARAQSGGVLSRAPAGYCQMTGINAAAKITAANCQRAAFTATGTGTSLNVTAVASGLVNVNDAIAGTGVPAGTYIAAQVSGLPNGVGVYTTNNPTTSNGASLTSGGVPQGATVLEISAETQAIRWRDDNQAPTATVGMPIAAAALPFVYSGSLVNIQFINQVSGGIIDLAFYK